VSFTFPTPGGAQTAPPTTSKTWIAYRASISPSATNLVGAPHDFTITVEQDRGDGNGFVPVPDGTTLAVDVSDPTKVTGNTCTAPGPGTVLVGGRSICTVTVTSASPGSVTVTPGAITVQLLDGTGATVPVTVDPGTAAYAQPAGATKTWVSPEVTVTPPAATNLVGVSHTFTVHVNVLGLNGTPTPAPDGSTVTWTFDGPGTLAAGATTCNTPGTVGGDCAIVFTNTNNTPGSGTLTITSVTFTVNGQPFNVDLTAAGSPPPPTATKTWIAYHVTVTPAATNPVGTTHDFTIHATRDNGTPPPVDVAGAQISFNWTGAGTLLTTSPCTTNAAGTCTVSVSSTGAGIGTLTVTSLNDAGTIVTLTAGSPGLAADQQTPLTTTKTWLQYRVLLGPAATNLVGEPHTFHATVQQTGVTTPTEADWTAVPNGTTLTGAATGTGTLDTAASTCLTTGTTAGDCTFLVTDNGPGTLTLNVTAIADTTVDGNPFANIALTTPATTTKTWVNVAVTVTPPTATNLVGQTHTFTAHVDVVGLNGPQPAPDGAMVTWTFDGPGTIDAGATTCDTIGTVNGDCNIVFTNTNNTPGSGTLTITSATFSFNGRTVTVDLTSAATGEPPITAQKTWIAYHVSVTPNAMNPVGTTHDFTITATRDNGTPPPVPVDGAQIAFDWTGAGTLLTTSPCTTDAAGTCTVSVSSPTAGTGTLTVTSITDGTTVVDLTAGAPGLAANQRVPLTTTKTWLQYRVVLPDPATNLVGETHTFIATVQQTGVADPTEADWTAVPDGTTLTANATGTTGTLSPTASTCLEPNSGTTCGACTLVVTSNAVGTLTLTVTAIAGTTLGGTDFSNIALTTPSTTAKTWVSVDVTVTPGTATNVAGQDHTFTVHVNVLGLNGPQPAPDGSTATWTFDGPGTTAPGTTCTNPGTTSGTCNITLANNQTAGTGTLTITSVTFTVNGQELTAHLTAAGSPPPPTATKTWINYRITVSPAIATNIVGQPHTFTVLVERDMGTGFEPLADAPVSLSATGTAVPTLNPPIPSTCTTDAAGECKITTTSGTPGTIILTATYDAASDAGPVSFTGTGQKTWDPAGNVVGPEAQAPVPPAVIPPPAPSPGLLPRTGAGMLVLLLAVLCLLAGTVLTVVRRRRAHRST